MDGTENLSLSFVLKSQLKFVVPFQDGFDGDDPTTLKVQVMIYLVQTHKDSIVMIVAINLVVLLPTNGQIK